MLLHNVAMSDGLQNFKESFIRMLIATSVDFSVRSIDNAESRDRADRTEFDSFFHSLHGNILNACLLQFG